MRLATTLQLGPLRLALAVGTPTPEPEPAPAPVEVVFLNPEHDDEDCREFIDGLHRDLGNWSQ